LFDGELRVVCASDSFCSAFAIRSDKVDGRLLAGLGAGEWNISQLRSLLDGALAGDPDIPSYETDFVREGQESRRLVLKAHKLAYDDAENPRVLLSIDDVTDERRADRQAVLLLFEKDDLLRERAVMIEEMNHRVANSLQIIASVLMLKARKVSSEEARLHLHDAHARVISMAAVQTHLQASLSDVAIAPYLTKLCQSLGDSMIRDPSAISLTVDADAETVSSREAVSLGLIVTELVINALKHAFPNGRRGAVTVEYRAGVSDWALSVTDDGVGRATKSTAAKAGLGTSVVEALAHQLHAKVVITNARPGAKVTIESEA
jgi:two-component sensor histidine kinase